MAYIYINKTNTAMKNLLTLILAFLATLIHLNLSAQDPGFSQFYSNPMYLSPVFAGTAAPYRVVVNRLRQYVGDVGRNTSAISVDGQLKGDQSGWGSQVVNDAQYGGIFKSTSVNGSLAHRIALNKKSQLGMGLQLGVYEKRLNWDQLTFEDQYDPRNGLVGSLRRQKCCFCWS